MAGIDETRTFMPVRIAILTVSDTRSLEDDTSGALLVDRLTKAGHHLADRAISRDEPADIQAIIKRWAADPEIDAIITTGGTGLTGRDVTPEAVRPLFEKEIDGFSVLMHMISFQKVGTSTVQAALAWRRDQRHLCVLRAWVAGGLPRCLGRDPQSAARFPPPAVQFRRDHAEASGASEASEIGVAT